MTEGYMYSLIRALATELLSTKPIHTGEWQSIDTSKSVIHATHEMLNVAFDYSVPDTIEQLSNAVGPHLPWAEEHFLERVSGIPHNPPPSHVNWPWAKHNGKHQVEEKFSHTYPERFWPKHAGEYWPQFKLTAYGIRFRYGDFRDVVRLLVRSPLTRQAYLPVWFPEDTGNLSNVRVPCSLGYHFMIRNQPGGYELDCWYAMRSCDLIRHFQDDVYMAGRLMQQVCEEVNHQWSTGGYSQEGSIPYVKPGVLHMTISSLHAFSGDAYTLKTIADGSA